MRSLFLCAAFAALQGLAACGGMNRAVTTVPRTFDDLGARTAPLRSERSADGRQPAGQAAPQ